MPWAKDWPPARRALLVAYAALGIVASGVSFATDQSKNLRIFLGAARDLLAGRNAYASTEFKYSPAFAFFFVPFTWAPPWLAALSWGLVNFLAVFYGLDRAIDDERRKRAAMTVALLGIVLVTDGDQSNLLITGGMLLAFRAFEDERPVVAGLVLAACAVVKIFPALALALVLFDRRRWPAIPAFAAGVLAASAAPIAALGSHVVRMEHLEWRALLAREAVHNRGWSLMGVVHDGLGLDVPNAVVQGIALAVLGAVLAATIARRNDRAARLRFLAVLLVLMVLVNHRSEYCTLVISAVGVAVWCSEGPRHGARIALVALAFLAPGPFYAVGEGGRAPWLAVLTAPRIFHSFRVLPLFAVWIWMLVDAARALRPSGETRGRAPTR